MNRKILIQFSLRLLQNQIDKILVRCKNMSTCSKMLAFQEEYVFVAYELKSHIKEQINGS